MENSASEKTHSKKYKSQSVIDLSWQIVDCIKDKAELPDNMNIQNSNLCSKNCELIFISKFYPIHLSICMNMLFN